MQVRVAYDTRIFLNEFGRNDPKSGIYREAEEIMREFSKRDDINLTLVYFDEAQFTDEFLKSSLWFRSDPDLSSYLFTNNLRSRLQLINLYEKIYDFQSTEYFQKLSKTSVRSILLRITFKLVQVLRKFDTYCHLNETDFDVFHSTYHKLPSKKITKGLPRVLTIQDLIPVMAPDLVHPSLTHYFCEILSSIDQDRDWVICISEHTRQEFCEYTGMSLDRTCVTPLASASHFYPVNDISRIAAVRQRYGIPEGNYFLSLASHLAPHKNLDHLIHCFFQLLSENPNLDINLILAGSRRYKPGQTIDSSEFSQFNSRVIYTGYIDDEDLSAVYSGATAFIFPSLYEGFGLPPLEAMSCGTPVICSKVTSLPEVVGDAGILVDPKDRDALCQAMLNVLKDSSLLQNLHQRGLARAQQFSWANCAEKTAEFYKKIISC